MLSNTRRALEDFDNSHDFERMCADILNALGYTSVEPTAPGGGGDGGQDIRFCEGDVDGTALVTLNKKIVEKFRRDLAKQPAKKDGLLALFCVVDVSPSHKFNFSQEAIAKGYRLDVFDIERLRSLLDGSFTVIRRRYLHIDDVIAQRLRSEVTKLIRFPKAFPDTAISQSLLEGMLIDSAPRRVFEMLMSYEEKDILEVPTIGNALHGHMTEYYAFRDGVQQIEQILHEKIGSMVQVRFPKGWSIYLRYVLFRFSGLSQLQIEAGGSFLNFDITWVEAERVYKLLAADAAVSAKMKSVFIDYERMRLAIQVIGRNL